jgi:hypothetical protein
MKNYILLFFSSLALFFAGCETVVDLDLEQGEPRLAVEAIVTDQAGLNYVQLTMSAPYASQVAPAPVTDAQVTLSDDAGNSTVFAHAGQGQYKPAPGFAGVVGRSYQLSIRAKGQSYTAASVLHPVPALEEVTYEYVDGKNDQYGRQQGYYISSGFQDRPGVKEYYKINLEANDTLVQRSPADILVSDDRLYDGSHLEDLDIFIPFKKGDALQVSLLSLTPEAYDFYAAMAAMVGQGGLFGRNPANLPTNISNGAVGFFSASAVSARSLVIE